MADLAESDITYTQQSTSFCGPHVTRRFKLEFGDGAKTYPVGGIPLSLSKMGFPTVLDSFKIFGGNGLGYVFEYDHENRKLKAYYGDYDVGADGPLVEVANAVTLAATTLYAEVTGH